MATLETKLRRILYRHTCPDPMRLGEYHLDLLEADSRRSIQDHLGLCPHCRREVAQLAGFLVATRATPQAASEPTILEKVKIFLIDLLIPDPEAGDLLPAVRAGENELQEQTQFRVRRAGEYLVSISIQPRAGSEARTIIGDIANMDNPASTFDDWTLHFWQDGRLMQADPLSDTGSFVLDITSKSRFELILSGPDVEIHLQHAGYG